MVILEVIPLEEEGMPQAVVGVMPQAGIVEAVEAAEAEAAAVCHMRQPLMST